MPQQPYHHGDLPRALLDGVAELLREGGVEAVTLRGVARRAGVSHAAPAHHFGDLGGLLAAFTAEGFRAFHAHLRATVAGLPADATAHDALHACGLGYLRFALEDPLRYGLMFRPEKVDCARPELVAAGGAAYGGLLAISRACLDRSATDDELTGFALSAWAMVHGFVSLVLDLPVEDVDHLPEPVRSAEAVLATLEQGLRAHRCWVGDDTPASAIAADLTDPLAAA